MFEIESPESPDYIIEDEIEVYLKMFYYMREKELIPKMNHTLDPSYSIPGIVKVQIESLSKKEVHTCSPNEGVDFNFPSINDLSKRMN